MVDFIKDDAIRLIGRKVKIVCIDGDIHIGEVDDFTSKFDNDEGVASIEINTEKFNGLTVSIFENDIESMEEI